MTSEIVASFLTLSLLEIVLGIDNMIFIGLLTEGLPPDLREKTRRLGLLGAVVTRITMLMMVGWMTTLTTPLLRMFDLDFSGKSLILLGGGFFLLFKTTQELHDKIEKTGDQNPKTQKEMKKRHTMWGSITQIIIIDIVFSLDSVVTAVGMANNLSVMISANMVALFVMIISGNFVTRTLDKYQTLKILALSFLLLVGFVLVAEGLSFHIPKTYVYIAMAFSVFVEMLNIRFRSRQSPH
jgi:predicted tellurium resistance membrane protein TerC